MGVWIFKIHPDVQLVCFVKFWPLVGVGVQEINLYMLKLFSENWFIFSICGKLFREVMSQKLYRVFSTEPQCHIATTNVNSALQSTY